MKKKIAVAVSLLLVVALSIGGTIAWLTDSETVTNTFTIGNVDITLTETDTDLDTDQNDKTNTYKFVPGKELAKDPKVTVTAGSEKCYVFVKIVENLPVKTGVTANFENYFTYSIRNDWQPLKNGGTDVPGVYYQEVASSETATTLYVLTGGETANSNGQITVKDSVTKEMVDNLNGNPTLTITAAAVQFEGMTDAYDAWTKLPNAITGITE